MDAEPNHIGHCHDLMVLVGLNSQTSGRVIFVFHAVHLDSYRTLGQDAEMVILVRMTHSKMPSWNLHLTRIDARTEVVNNSKINVNTHTKRFYWGLDMGQ